MDWKKAKNFTIIILVVLNVFLLALVTHRQKQYFLTDKQLQSIKTVLENNQITLDAPVLKNFSPMNTLLLTPPQWDIDQLKEAFWGKNAEIKISIESDKTHNNLGMNTDNFDKTILINNSETVTITGNSVLYQNPNKTEKIIDYSEQGVKEYADKYIKNFSPWFYYTAFDSISKSSDGYCIVYYQTYYEKPIFNNSIVLTINENGLTNLEMTYLKPEQLAGSKRDICSPDEALFTLMQQLKKRGQLSHISITKIDLGYALENYEILENEVKAIPYYNIVINENKKMYKINAYTNKLNSIKL